MHGLITFFSVLPEVSTLLHWGSGPWTHHFIKIYKTIKLFFLFFHFCFGCLPCRANSLYMKCCQVYLESWIQLRPRLLVLLVQLSMKSNIPRNAKSLGIQFQLCKSKKIREIMAQLRKVIIVVFTAFGISDWNSNLFQRLLSI